MDEKDLGSLFAQFAESNIPYSYMDYPRLVSRRVENQEGDLIDAQRVEMETRLMRDIIDKKTIQSSLEKMLFKKELSVAETLDLYKRGLKPYFYSHNANTLVELTLENENDGRTTRFNKWLHPKIAEKIQARYQEINDLVQKKEDAIREFDSQIEDLGIRIKRIEESGTDLII
jgi:hypothetical protein